MKRGVSQGVRSIAYPDLDLGSVRDLSPYEKFPKGDGPYRRPNANAYFQIKLPKSNYLPGEHVAVAIKITNDSDLPVVRMELRIVEMSLFVGLALSDNRVEAKIHFETLAYLKESFR